MNKQFFISNRHRLWEQLGSADSVFLCFSGLPHRRSADEDYPFFANRNFTYLTGLEQNDLIYMAWEEQGSFQERLFLPDTDPMYERWMGRMLHEEQIMPISGIESLENRQNFEAVFHDLVCGRTAPLIWLDFDPPGPTRGREPAQEFSKTLACRYPWCRIHNAHPIFRRMRTIKHPEEIAQLQESITLTDLGIRAMLKACRPGLYEYQLRAVFEQVLADHGDHIPAFDSIVAAGPNTLVMHYPEQDKQIADGDLILVDVGAQLGFCGADISRVFPANGKFTDRQRALHDASMTTIDALCTMVMPGMMMTDIDRLTGEVLFEKLKPMGLADRAEDVKEYIWHSTSHHLGFDTHDDNDYTMPISPGMVFTMEVGIYVPQWGEGVRIEDNILMTDIGCKNLSRQIPRSAEEIEALMAKEE